MKISELSQQSQVPVPSIKFYIREGLLPPGQRTSKNQADYGPVHVERLALIRALQEAADLRLDVIARALKAADSAKDDFVIAAIDALERPSQPQSSDAEACREAEQGLLRISKRRGWDVSGDDVSVRDAVMAAVRIKRWFEPDGTFEELETYFDAVDRIAHYEIPDEWAPGASREAALHYAMLGTVLFEPLILALRRMAHVARTRKLMQRAVADKPAREHATTTKRTPRTKGTKKR